MYHVIALANKRVKVGHFWGEAFKKQCVILQMFSPATMNPETWYEDDIVIRWRYRAPQVW